jgi:lysozyme
MHFLLQPETSKLTGGRIQGSDVSRWQHPNDKPIDFKKNLMLECDLF